jgi:hypothetical protein
MRVKSVPLFVASSQGLVRETVLKENDQ